MALLLPLLAARAGFAQAWDFTHAGDPNRNWGAVVTESAGYDDNFNATENNRQAGVRLNSDVKLRANIPIERLFLGIQYDYSVAYPRDVQLGGVNQSHNFNLGANYTVNPRLTLNANENFVDSLQPQLVQNNVSVVQAGTYIYDSIGGGFSFLMSPRWTLSLNGSWDIWDYQVAEVASNNNHQDYTATLSALYALDTRTTVGVNYQYSQDVFVNPGIDDGLNAVAHTLYLSYVRRFNPQFSMTLNGGYTIRNSADGSQSTSPSAYALFVYNYGPVDTINLSLAQALSEASINVTRQFSAQQNSTLDLQVSHRITVRLRVLGDITYIYSSFTQPLGGSAVNPGGDVPFPGNPFIPPAKARTISPNDQSLTLHLGLKYDFRDWISGVVDYYYTELVSSEALLIQPYTRDQITAGVSLTY